MSKGTKAIDTNLIIRYFTEDDPVKTDAVERLFKKAEAEKEDLEIPDVVLAEIVWVLLSFYELSKEKVIEKLEGLLALKKVKMNRQVLKRTVEIYRNHDISYIDAYLAAYALENNRGVIYSYDDGFNKIKGIKRLEP